MLLAAVAVALVLISLTWCRRDAAEGQPWAPRDMLWNHIQTGYQKQVERLYALLYEGYLTRPGHEPDADEKFKRGLRVARRARDRAIDMLLREPWEVVTPLPDPPPRRPR